jgi:polyisoprenyl-phosphate glycosyltransferase
VVGGAMVLVARLTGKIHVPGYSAIVLVLLFFGALTATGLGIIGQYVWLCLQNARNRPLYIIRGRQECSPAPDSLTRDANSGAQR